MKKVIRSGLRKEVTMYKLCQFLVDKNKESQKAFTVIKLYENKINEHRS